MAIIHFEHREAGASAEFDLNLDGLEGLIFDALEAQREAAIIEGEDWSDEVTTVMKANAKWQDITGNARASLGVVPEYGAHDLIYHLTGGVFYMEFLEQRFTGRFSILEPTTWEEGPKLLDRVGAERTK